ncbi:MAG: helix-turn-helix domain-containing protein [Planctomycetia bacterium]|nr:helix-turn-helix domain-containing protein [Planctomycetia bacterium]
MTTAALDRIAKSRSYRALVREFPPRPIRGRAALADAHRVVEMLMSLDRPSKDQLDYLELLSTLVERFEAEDHPTPQGSTSALLRHLIEVRGVSQTEVAARAAISPSTLSDVLAGRRPLSIKNIKRLSRYFAIDANLFLQSA